MAKPVSISLHKFTTSVQAAVKAAVAKHPKFRDVPEPKAVFLGHLIRGFPVPDGILSNVTVAETQAFAAEAAAQLAQAHPEALAAGRQVEGGFVSVPKHVVCGIPAVSDTVEFEA
jgi:hypothetical protein